MPQRNSRTPYKAPCLWLPCLSLRPFQKFFCMPARNLGDGPAQHPCYLFLPLGAGKFMYRNMHPGILLCLLDSEVMICQTGDLGQMRYAEQLMSLRNLTELPANTLCGL